MGQPRSQEVSLPADPWRSQSATANPTAPLSLSRRPFISVGECRQCGCVFLYVSTQARKIFGTQKEVTVKIFIAKAAIFLNKLAFSNRSLNLYQDMTSFMT